MKHYVDLIGRFFLAAIFILEAVDTLSHMEETKAILSELAITWNQDFFLHVGIVALLTGAILIIIGYRTGFATILICLYWIPATFIVYDFWEFPPEERRMVRMIFTKNIAIIGGLFILWINGSQRFSVRKILATTKVR